MSLDVTLVEYPGTQVFDANITHNLAKMANAAGIYDCLWRPDENGFHFAKQIIDPLEKGLSLLVCNKQKFEEYNSPNGWGLWIHFVPWCATYLQACRDYPDAKIYVSR